MAAAYLFHLAANHAFIDGNKRTGALAALVFLDVNEVVKLPPPKELETITFLVAAGETTKEKLIEWMRERVEEQGGHHNMMDSKKMMRSEKC